MATQQNLIILNGPAGVGKTTIGRALAATAANGVCIHGDDLSHFIVSRDSRVQGSLGYKNAATVAANFLDGGYELVIVEYVFEEPRHVQRFLDWATADVPRHLFTLWAPLETVLERERHRPNRAPLGDRVEQCHNTMQRHLADLGYIIHNDRDTPATVVSEISSAIAEGYGLVL